MRHALNATHDAIVLSYRLFTSLVLTYSTFVKDVFSRGLVDIVGMYRTINSRLIGWLTACAVLPTKIFA